MNRRLNDYDRQILRIAVPSIVSNITVPLLGLVDTAITGHLGATAYIGAIAVGSMLFNVIYWLFAFLRMGTSGLTAQAYGQRDNDECRSLLKRSLTMAFTIGAALIVLQLPVCQLGLLIMGPTDEVRRLTTTYFSICVYGAPAMLGIFSLNGWFIGMQNARAPMVVAIAQNIVNIVVSLILVYGFGMKVEGVATGTLVAQWAGFAMAALLAYKNIPAASSPARERSARSSASRSSLWRVNRDIFLRTLCLVSVLLFFTSAGSRQGDVILAVNTLLMQLYLLVSYVMDGFANAAEAMSGKYWGARNMLAFRQTVTHSFAWGSFCTALFTLLYIVAGSNILQLLTDQQTVISAAADYLRWAWLVPVCSIGAFVWDGVFIGITASRQMLCSSFLAAVVFFSIFFFCEDSFHNHALWLAFVAYMFTRGAVQTFLYKRILKAGKT